MFFGMPILEQRTFLQQLCVACLNVVLFQRFLLFPSEFCRMP